MEGTGKAQYTIHLLKELKIPFLLIVDKDFLCPYKNDSFDDSLDPQGFPLYKESFQDEEFIKFLIHDQTKRNLILKNINKNHQKILDELEDIDIICMRYSTDLDLVSIKKAQNRYHEMLKTPSDKKTTKYLTAQRKAIKKLDRMISAFDSLDASNWPYSYSRIKKKIKDINKSLN